MITDGSAFGISARTDGVGSNITIGNNADIVVTAGRDAFGIYAASGLLDPAIAIDNSKAIVATAAGDAYGIFERTIG